MPVVAQDWQTKKADLGLLIGVTGLTAPPNGVVFVAEGKEMNECDTVLTTATLGIAETGSIVLQARHPSLPGQGSRMATLIPDCHICIVHKDVVVETVPKAIRKLRTDPPQLSSQVLPPQLILK